MKKEAITVTGENVQEKTFNILEATKTNWSVKKHPLYANIGGEMVNTESYGIFKNTGNQWLGTVKGRYEPMQNSALVELLVQATDMLELPILNGGYLNNGAKVYYQIGLTDEHIGNSAVNRYVTALNTHDGTRSIAFGSTNTVVICNNTFHKTYRDADMAKVRHTANSNQRVMNMAMDIKAQIENDERLMVTFKRMADVNATEEMVSKLIKKLFTVKEDGNHSTRTANMINGFIESIEKEFILEGKTVWGLFNGVTRYTNHVLAPNENTGKRDDFLLNGRGVAVSNLAYDELLKVVEKNTAELVFVNR